MELIKFIHIFSIGVLASVVLIHAQEVCEQVNSCKCLFSNGSGIDLSPSAAHLQFYEAPYYTMEDGGKLYKLSTYYYHPCADIALTVIDLKANNTCNIPLAICRHVNKLQLDNNSLTDYKIDAGVYDYIGSSNETVFSADGHILTYLHKPSQTNVQLVCAESDDKLHVVSLDDPNNITLAFFSRNACLQRLEEAGRSVGSTLCIIFFALVFLYLVLGICTKKFLMGATGVEIIPNLGFWSDLPNLVKEGWAFAISGFKLPARGAPAASPDPNSYDSI